MSIYYIYQEAVNYRAAMNGDLVSHGNIKYYIYNVYKLRYFIYQKCTIIWTPYMLVTFGIISLFGVIFHKSGNQIF